MQIVPELHVGCGEGKREGRGDVVGPGLGTLLMLGDDDGAGLVDGCADGGMEGPAVGGGVGAVDGFRVCTTVTIDPVSTEAATPTSFAMAT